MKDYEYYVKEIKKLGMWLIEHAADIALTENDYKNKLRNLTLFARIEHDSIPTWDISKEYDVMENKPKYYIDGIRVDKSIVDIFKDNLIECATIDELCKNHIKYVSIGVCDKLNEILEKYKNYKWSDE